MAHYQKRRHIIMAQINKRTDDKGWFWTVEYSDNSGTGGSEITMSRALGQILTIIDRE